MLHFHILWYQLITTHHIHLQATNERREAELHQKKDEKNINVVKIAIKNMMYLLPL